MPYRYDIDEGQNLAVVRLRDMNDVDLELEAVSAYLGDPRLRPEPRILIDRRDAPIVVPTEYLSDYAWHVGRMIASLRRPRVAVVVGNDRDYGISRMFEMRSEGELDHQFAVFRTVEEAVEWLDLDAERVVWPAFNDE